MSRNGLSRRTGLRRGAILSTSIGLALLTTTGRAVAMNGAELIEQMASEAGLSKSGMQTALDAFINATTKALKKGERVSLGEEFGEFTVSQRSARGARHRQTGKEIQIAAKNVVTFKAGAELSKAVN